MPHTKSLRTPRRTLYASLHSRNAHGHVRRAILCENSAPQERGPCFVRACAIEMHMDMSEEQFFGRIYKKNAAPQERGPRFAAQSKCTWTCHKSNCMREFTGKKTGPKIGTTPVPRFCASLEQFHARI